MVSAVMAYLTRKQRKTLFTRARRHGSTLSEEVRKAIDLYLDLPPSLHKERWAALAKEANGSLDRSIARLDEAILYCRQSMERIGELERR